MLIKELNKKEEVAPEKEWCVYVHTTPSGKKYVGITSQEPEDRWKNGRGYKGCPAFYNAIKKYGWASIEHDIIASHLTESEANAFEILMIKKLDTHNPEHGYNLTTGGDGVRDYTYFEEAKKRSIQTQKQLFREKHLVPVYQYDRDLNFIERFDSALDACEAINGNTTKYYLIYECCDLKAGRLTAFGYVWSYLPEDEVDKEFLLKRIMHTGLPKKIYQYDLEGNLINTFNSISEAAKFIGKSNSSISSALNGKCRTSNGFVWLNEGEEFVKPKNIRERSVDQYTLDGEYIRTFDSYRDAARKLGVAPSSISAACNSESHRWREYILTSTCDKSLIELHKKDTYNNRHVLQIDENGNIVHEYLNLDDACNATGINRKQLQNKLINKSHATNGYFWFFKDDEDGLRSFVPHKIIRKIAVSKIDDDGNVVDTYSSLKQAASINHVSEFSIKKALNDTNKKCGGYKWTRAN